MGLEATVMDSTDQNRKKKSGRIVSETKNTVTLETKTKEIVLPKREVTLEVKLGQNQFAVIRTSEWCFAPEDRVKAFAKKN